MCTRSEAVTGTAETAAAAPFIRAATHADVPALAAIEALCGGTSAQWSAADIEAELSRPFARCLIAEPPPPLPPPARAAAEAGPARGGGVSACGAAGAHAHCGAAGIAAGFVVAWLVAGEAQVLELAVHPGHRRRGLAAALLSAVLCSCGCEEGAPATLEVRADNAAALALYSRHGFLEAGRRRRYYPDGADAVLMTRSPGPLAPGQRHAGG